MGSRFKSELLTAKSGSLFGFLHENSNVGLPLGMYWNFYLPFEDFTADGAEFSCSVLIDWMTLPIKSWRNLDSKRLEDLLDPDRLEVSFYLFEHQEAVLKALQILREEGPNFKVDYELNVPELIGPNGEEWKNIVVKSTASVKFEGFYILPGNLALGPKSQKEAEDLLCKFLHVDEFEKPFWDNDFRYTFLPKNDSSR